MPAKICCITIYYIITLVFLVLITTGIAPIFAFLKPSTSQESWKTTAAGKKHDVMTKIPNEWLLEAKVIDAARLRQSISGDFFEELLDDQTRSITALNETDLVESMRDRSLTAVEVVKAFGKRAAYAHQLGIYLLDIGFRQAITRAEELDNYVKQHGRLVGPLHGIPVTLKDQFHVQGMETTLDYVGWVGTFEGKNKDGNESMVESELVRELRLLGAIPIGKVRAYSANSAFSILSSTNLMWRIDNPKVYHGAPASIQLIGKSREEERLLSMASLVVKALAKYKTKRGGKS